MAWGGNFGRSLSTLKKGAHLAKQVLGMGGFDASSWLQGIAEEVPAEGAQRPSGPDMAAQRPSGPDMAPSKPTGDTSSEEDESVQAGPWPSAGWGCWHLGAPCNGPTGPVGCCSALQRGNMRVFVHVLHPLERAGYPGCFAAANCDDDNACSLDVCHEGKCQHVFYHCEWADACIVSDCEASTGICRAHANPFECQLHSFRTKRVCVKDCDDGNPRTEDWCMKGICVHRFLGETGYDDEYPSSTV
eukprot:g75995.t1